MSRTTTRKPAAAKTVAAETVETTQPVETAAETKQDAKADIKAKFQQAIDDAKARSRDNRLAMLGLIANSRKASNERKTSLIEAGRAYEPELEKQLEELKSKFKFDGAKKGFSFELPKLDKAAKKDNGEPSKLSTMLNERLAQSFEKLGLPTRKDFDALSKKVDKLIELQRA